MAKLRIRSMAREEVDELVSWAAAEGWNPGRQDAQLFWQNHPEAFIAAELEGELIGGGAITSYDGTFGFMGFFIIRPEYRGQGFGDVLWQARKTRLLGRLTEGAAIGMDGVLNMRPYYEKGGFKYQFTSRRLENRQTTADMPATLYDDWVVPLSDVPEAALLEFDRSCFPAHRANFLKAWSAQTGAGAWAVCRDQDLAGYVIVRPAEEGFKVGPLFAKDQEVARTLYRCAAAFAAGAPLVIDVPDRNPDAVALFSEIGLKEVFSCARLYLGPAPDLRDDWIYGVTSFEIG